jgi:glutamate--cysteine ligase
MIKTLGDDVPQFSIQAGAQSLDSLLLLQTRLQEKQKAVCQWFEQQWKKTPPPIYGSVDLRNAGFKLAPIDMNLFPAGFNNLNPHFLAETIQAAQASITELAPGATEIGLIPESHTRNLFYWENVRALSDILKQAGFKVSVGSLSEEFKEATELKLPSGKTIEVEPLTREKNRLQVGASTPDLILLNNDLSSGIPAILQNVEQPLLPPAELGWHQRLKSGHFQYYAELSQEFAALLGLDSWLITPLFRYCGEIDFLRREGLDCLIEHTRVLLEAIQQKYQEYGVMHQPFVMVKADAGTQGMAVMTVRSIDELRTLNRKQRTSMAKSKGGVPVTRVIVQEGVYTFETFGSQEKVAEPVIYLWGKRVAGGFYRIHQDRGRDENLNTPGMQFESLPFASSCCSWSEEIVHPYQKQLATYGVIAQLSMLAAAREIAG